MMQHNTCPSASGPHPNYSSVPPVLLQRGTISAQLDMIGLDEAQILKVTVAKPLHTII